MPTPEENWFLQFANEADPNEQGRPWGDETAIAKRQQQGKNPWDENCRVTSLIGGHATMVKMREKLEEAIAGVSRKPFGECGHVYFTDWRFNPLRDISDKNAPFQPGVGLDPTILGWT